MFFFLCNNFWLFYFYLSVYFASLWGQIVSLWGSLTSDYMKLLRKKPPVLGVHPVSDSIEGTCRGRLYPLSCPSGPAPTEQLVLRWDLTDRYFSMCWQGSCIIAPSCGTRTQVFNTGFSCCCADVVVMPFLSWTGFLTIHQGCILFLSFLCNAILWSEFQAYICYRHRTLKYVYKVVRTAW